MTPIGIKATARVGPKLSKLEFVRSQQLGTPNPNEAQLSRRKTRIPDRMLGTPNSDALKASNWAHEAEKSQSPQADQTPVRTNFAAI